tara:strand:+ start:25200 stop:26690 length:1491 start_codon:yes stop_codon:yes gene_type:complete
VDITILHNNISDENVWSNCLDKLKEKFSDKEHQFKAWIKPLTGEFCNNHLKIYAPNSFICNWVKSQYLPIIYEALIEITGSTEALSIDIFESKNKVGGITEKRDSRENNESQTVNNDSSHNNTNSRENSLRPTLLKNSNIRKSNNLNNSTSSSHIIAGSNLNPNFTFETFVEGKSNQLARAAAGQVAQNPGSAYNPLFLYGGVGLGKTHLMHAVGNLILDHNPKAKVVYLHSERFVADMVKALQSNRISEFKKLYRSVDALLIDDIQFFAGKERSQEEFFHTFNALLEGQQQVILTCDRYPKEINGVEERLKSRFGWGLTVAVEPPELETRVAILISKADKMGVKLDNDVAFFIGKRVRSNVRELEGVLKRVVANSQFTGRAITIEFVGEALRDLFAIQDKLVTIDNIQKTVAEFFKIRVADLLSKRRNRSIARPRQTAMALAKELTNHSLPEIGDSFGGRDHTTVLHACKIIAELRVSSTEVQESYSKLLRILST